MRILLPIGFVLLASCSSSESSPAVADTGSDTPIEDTATGDSAPTTKGLGYVAVQRQDVGGKTVVVMNGGFFDNSGEACPSVENHGPCQITRCPATSPVGKKRDAGTISVVHGSDPAVELKQSSNYASEVLPSTYFKEGDTVVFSSTGAEVPAFAAKSVVAPGDLTATLPTEIDRTKDLTLTWSGDKTGDVRIMVSTTSASGDAETISCVMPASSGSITIAKDDLAKLTGSKGFLNLGAVSEVQAESAGWSVSLSVEALGASGEVTLH